MTPALIAARQEGDTIVEVLICIAIVALILTGAFVVTNRSQLGVRDSQEHAEASKLLEGQLEQLRSDSQGTGDIFSAKWNGQQPFCMVDGESMTASDPSCMLDNSGMPTKAEPQYRIKITRKDNQGVDDGSGQGSGSTFTVTASWDSVTGHGGKNGASETMEYRLYE